MGLKHNNLIWFAASSARLYCTQRHNVTPQSLAKLWDAVTELTI